MHAEQKAEQEQRVVPKVEIGKYEKVLRIVGDDGSYAWSPRNSIHYDDHGVTQKCYYAVLKDQSIPSPSQHAGNRMDLLTTIHNLDGSRGTNADIYILEKYAKIDGMRVVIE
jgi:hypothetical protein